MLLALFFTPTPFFFAPPPRLARARSLDVSPVISPFNLRQSSRFDLRSTLLFSSFPFMLKSRQEVLARPLSATPSFSATVQPLSATDRRRRFENDTLGQSQMDLVNAGDAAMDLCCTGEQLEGIA